MKLFTAMAVLVALSACSSTRITVTEADITPVYAGQAPENLNISVVDHRSFILSGNKGEWFEGVIRGSYGIPTQVKRSWPQSDQPFALYLSSMLADAMIAAGSDVTIVRIAMGNDIDEAIRQTSNETNTPSIIFLMYVSRYDAGGDKAAYNHQFDVFVVNKNGETLTKKTFSRLVDSIQTPSVKDYYILDFYDMVYKKVLDEILNDRDIATALAEASIS
jgi:hypothetical protein